MTSTSRGRAVEIVADGAHDGPTNMARDLALLQRAELGEALCRVYGWSGPWVSLGRFQKPSEAVVEGWDAWVMRPTGGRAVFHGHDATVGLALPLTLLGLESRAIRPVYRAVVRPLVAALQACGLDARLAEDTAYVRGGAASADCFAAASPNDIVNPSTGQKVCGCALRVTERAVLLQASIPKAEPLVDPSLAIVGGLFLPVSAWRHEDLAEALRDALG